MSWWRSFRRFIRYDPPPPPNVSKSTPEEAWEARERAERALEDAHDRRLLIDEVTGALALIRERNHFGESIELAMTRRKPR
jgi:hypothetical protein